MEQEEKTKILLYLGDHDPSGIDMTRDIQKRLRIFGSDAEVRRIALTMEQIEELNPPPNFAKMSDSRAEDYVARYGMSSWELDALKPQYITDLIEKAVVDEINTDVWTDALEESEDTKDRLREFVDTFE